MNSPKEARLLAVERKQARIGQIIREAKIDLRGAGQGIWDAWSDVAAPGTPTPTPPPVPSFPAICSAFPITMPLLNSLYGGCILTWDGGTHWTGCQTAAIPAGGGCGAVGSSAAFYSLAGDNTTSSWVLTIAYQAGAGPNFCAVNGANCSSTPNRSDTTNATISCCAPYQFNYAHGNIASPIFGNQDINLVVTPFVGNLTPASTIAFTSTGTFYSGVSGTLVWDGVSAWTACVAGISFVGSGSCLAVTMAITFSLDQYGKFTMKWLTTTATNCPATSNCASTAGAGQTMVTKQCFYNSDSCPSSVTYKLNAVFGTDPQTRLGTPTITLAL